MKQHRRIIFDFLPILLVYARIKLNDTFSIHPSSTFAFLFVIFLFYLRFESVYQLTNQTSSTICARKKEKCFFNFMNSVEPQSKQEENTGTVTLLVIHSQNQHHFSILPQINWKKRKFQYWHTYTTLRIFGKWTKTGITFDLSQRFFL